MDQVENTPLKPKLRNVQFRRPMITKLCDMDSVTANKSWTCCTIYLIDPGSASSVGPIHEKVMSMVQWLKNFSAESYFLVSVMTLFNTVLES